jgi:signal transduction histidine kinase
MKGFLVMLDMVEGKTMSAEGHEYLTIVTEATENLIELTNSVLDVSKMEAGEMTLDLSEFNLTDIIQGLMDKLESLRKNREFIIEAPDEATPVTGDAVLITRIIQNLLGNALKFTPDEGSIAVGYKTEQDCTRIYVRDTGPGIPQESMGRIFEKFGQVKTQPKQKQYSTGLGLTFCKLAVEAHGGTIGVDSEVGKGSTFWFTIPQMEPKPND